MKDKAKPGFERDRKMLGVISDEIKKTLGKEIDYEEALLIFTLLSEEEENIKSKAEDKPLIKSAARNSVVGSLHI